MIMGGAMQHRERVPAGEEAGGRVTQPGAAFARSLSESGLILPGQTVLVALSGGVDSMILLHLLLSIRESWGLKLIAAHFDHRMRPESAADTEWVGGLCRAWEVPFVSGAAATGLKGQDAARTARYQFLEEEATRSGADRIATAHHADDQAETVLFRISRGTGMHGLAGIPARRGRVVRPLLTFWRSEIEAYARSAGIPYREDPTNRSVDYARNRLRLEVLPRLEEIAPGAARSIVRLAADAAEEIDAWNGVIDALEPAVVLRREEDLIELARAPLLSYHPRVRGMLLRRLLHGLGSNPDREATRAALEFIDTAASGSRIDIAGGARMEREFDHFRISRVVGEEGSVGADPVLRIAGPGSGAGEMVLGGGRRFTIRWMWDGEGEPETSATFDPAALRFPLEIRNWRPGDRIQLSYGTKKLKKLFAEHRVGRADRARTPILAEAEGRVLWVVGIARATIAAPAPDRPNLRIVVTDTES
jgi:tRNA(Ile)-lysidine synthase